MSPSEEPPGTPPYTRISVRHARHTDASALPDGSAARRTRPVEGRPLNICEMCGAANGELETECRICGHPLATQTEPVATAAAQPQAEHRPCTGRRRPGRRFAPVAGLIVSPVHPTGAPPMLGNAPQADPVHMESESETDSAIVHAGRRPRACRRSGTSRTDFGK